MEKFISMIDFFMNHRIYSCISFSPADSEGTMCSTIDVYLHSVLKA